MQRAKVLDAQTGVGGGLVMHGNVGVLELDNAPLNALGHSVRVAIMRGLDQAERDPNVHAIVVTGKGRAFSAGADISEFSSAMKEPFLPECIDRLEASKKPVVAAVNGMALGGGCEVALGCHFRVGHAKASVFGLPEIKLGLIPGAGGTQRLPRVCGPQFAIQMCCSGGNIKPPVALKNGLLDAIAPEGANVVEFAVKFAQDLVAKKTPIRRSCDQTAKLGNCATNFFLFRAARQQLVKSVPKGMISPLAALDAVQAATSASDFKAGMKAERDIFMKLAQSTQAGAMQHFFKSERRALKIPGLERTAPAPVRRVGVIGGGTMGGGIAMCFLNIGVPVTLIETSADRQKYCVETIANNYKITMAKGKLTKEAFDKRMGLLTVVVNDWAALSDADMVIEAVFENMAL